MSTCGLVCVRTGSREIRTAYNHFDSYPEYLGEVLNEHYDSYEKAVQLIEAGKYGFSTIGETIESCECYSERDPSITPTFTSIEKAKKYASENWLEYVYVFNPSNNSWKCFKI